VLDKEENKYWDLLAVHVEEKLLFSLKTIPVADEMKD